MSRDRDDDFDLFSALDDRPGPARPLGPEARRTMVERALEAALAPSEISEPARPPVRAGGRRLRGLLVAAVVLGGLGVASAAVVRWVASERAAAPADEPAPARSTERAVAAPPDAAVPDAEPALEPEADEPALEPETDEPTLEAAPRRVPRAAPKRPAQVDSVDDLLERANRQRREHNWRGADQLYQEVISAAPKSLAAYVALVASASIRLEHLGDPAGARRRFERALRQRPDGALGEEIRYGLAEAHRALGDPAAEARALANFLAAHPGSPLRGRAEQRLRALRAEVER